MDNGQRSASQGRFDRTVNGATRVPVTFWMPDGSCDEGMTRHVGGEVMFIESKRIVPIGTEVTISLTTQNDAAIGEGVAEGVVVWACPTGDQFQNGEGFGVSLQGCWPQQPGGTETEGSTKGAA